MRTLQLYLIEIL